MTVTLTFMLAVPNAAFSAGASSAEDGWELINTDSSGNRTYIDAGSTKRSEGSTITVTMRFVSERNGSDMYFVDELDCERGLIKRLSVSLKGPPCTGGIDYDSSFEGKWDRISTGLEERLREAVCGGDGEHLSE